MNFIRKLLGFFTAVAFVAMAAPATAQNVKYFTLGAPRVGRGRHDDGADHVQERRKRELVVHLDRVQGIATGGATLTINSATASPGGPGSPLVTGDGYST
ncbi:MAG: hypothetical protein IPF73_19585 [Betaproteobacteria bacterium]|nr:hypothetical protein [Betaproteobacteria bacterium]